MLESGYHTTKQGIELKRANPGSVSERFEQMSPSADSPVLQHGRYQLSIYSATCTEVTATADEALTAERAARTQARLRRCVSYSDGTLRAGPYWVSIPGP